MNDIILIMPYLNIKVLKKIIDKVPEDFSIEFSDGDNVYRVKDKLEIDVGKKKIIFRKY